METPGSAPASSTPAVVLEATLLKQGDRARRRIWHERYFVLQADSTLLYYHRKGDPKPKASFTINDLTDVEIGEIFVQKHHKQVVYCFNITWAQDAAPTDSVDESSHGGSVVLEPVKSEDDIVVKNPAAAEQSSLTKRSPFRKPLHLHRRAKTEGQTTPVRKHGRAGGSVASEANVGRSVDGESLTLGSRMRLRRSDSARTPGSGAKLAGIPSLVEVETQEHALPPQHSLEEHLESTKTVKTSNVRNLTPHKEDINEEQEYLRAQFNATQKANKKKYKKRMVQGTQLALATGAAVGVAVATAGIGLVAGLVVFGVGAAAGGGSAAVNILGRKREGEIVIASADYEEVKLWKTTLEACLDSKSLKRTTWGQLFASDGRETRSLLLRQGSKNLDSDTDSPGQQKRNRHVLLEHDSQWIPLEGGWASFLGTGVQGLRIFREERKCCSEESKGTHASRIFTKLSVDGRPCPPVKANCVMKTSALDAFLCLMSYGRMDTYSGSVLAPKDGQQASFRLVTSIDDHTDIIHLVFRPLYLFPSWTTPRDFVLFRYWRFEPDGTYIICYESVEHIECPPHPDYVRGEMHQVFTVAPLKKKHRRRANGNSKAQPAPECLMTAVVQVDPKGWVPVSPLPFLSNQSYSDAFGVGALLQLLDIRDAIDQDRFVSVSVDSGIETEHHVQVRSDELDDSPPVVQRIRSMDSADDIHDDPVNYDFTYANRESVHTAISDQGFVSIPAPLPMERWAEPDPNSFRVRGKNYLDDRKKFNAGPSIGRLVAVDVVRVDQSLYSGFSTHPTERVQLALRREERMKARGLASDLPPFIFVVNIVLPGPPFFHGVFYFAIDEMSKIDGTDGTPSSRLCNEFFFGDRDEFRDKTFKMIPQIVQGNFIVRKAVGSTPAIMGTKLRQLYVKGERFFEVILDCGSSAVATGVIRLSLGYAKTLVVDMGFLFEGDDESTLPERIVGCVRCKKIEFDERCRKVEAPP